VHGLENNQSYRIASRAVVIAFQTFSNRHLTHGINSHNFWVMAIFRHLFSELSVAFSLRWPLANKLFSLPRSQRRTQAERHPRKIQREAFEARNQVLTKVAVQLVDTRVHPGGEDRDIL
jgi:hypothetical protein